MNPQTRRFSDIILTIPTYDDDNESWYSEHIWMHCTGKRTSYTICDSDGNHEPISKRDVNDLSKREHQLRLDYSAWVVRHDGEDPIGEFFVKRTKTMKRNYVAHFRHWVGEQKHGLALTHVRWAGGLQTPYQLPEGFRAFLCAEKVADRWCMAGITVKELQDAPDVGYVGKGYFKGTAEWKENLPEEKVRKAVIRAARKHLKKG